jgi:cbb3-type cytochrome oxidase maturation protein
MDLGPLIAISIALGVLAWLAFLWSVRSGQYDDPEGPKYRMLDDDDERPGRPAAGASPGPEDAAPPARAGDAPATSPGAPPGRPPPDGSPQG